MASTGAIRAGRAFVELFADDSRLVRGLRRAQAKLQAFGTAVRDIGLKMAGLGAAVVAPIAAAARSWAAAGGELYDMSKRTGIAVEDLSLLSYAAAQTGSSLEAVERGVRIMQKSIAGAADAAEGTTGKLEDLGLTAKDLSGKGPAEQFAIIAGRLRAIIDPTERAAAALKVFGRSGTMLLPLIEDFDRLAKEARDFRLIRTTADAKRAKQFSDAMTLMARVVKSAWMSVGSAIAPVLQANLQRWTRLVAQARDWIKANSGLVVSIFKLGMATIAAGLGLAVLGAGLAKLGTILGLAATALKVVGAVLGAILSPIGLVTAAVGALGAYILIATGAGAKALGWLGERFADLKDDATAAYQGIADALAAGDIGLAARVLWLTLKMEWTKGTNALSATWDAAILWLRKSMAEGFNGLEVVNENLLAGLEVGWIETTAFLSNVWTKFTTAVWQAWDWVAKSLEQSWNWIKGTFSDFDAEAANAAIEKRYQQGRDAMWDAAKAQLGEREAQRAAQCEKVQDVHTGLLGEIITKGDEQLRSLQGDYDAKMAANTAELEQARKEWLDAIALAAANRTDAEYLAGGPGELASPDDLLAKFQDQLAGVGDILAKQTVGVAGTFNAANLLGLQAGSADDRIANATERTAKGIDALRQDVRSNRAEFV